MRAERPNHVWALDFQFDQTADGKILKLLHVVDEFTREALAIECHRRIDADATVAVLERLVRKRGRSPQFIRCDNGPELTANALRDYYVVTDADSFEAPFEMTPAEMAELYGGSAEPIEQVDENAIWLGMHRDWLDEVNRQAQAEEQAAQPPLTIEQKLAREADQS